MSDKVLIDTSIWIEYFRTPGNSCSNAVSSFLRNEEACYTDIIALELIRRAKTRKELSILETLFSTIERLTATETTFREAGLLGCHLARKGINLGTVDLLIARLTIEHKVPLFTRDQHFKAIARISPLKLYTSV